MTHYLQQQQSSLDVEKLQGWLLQCVEGTSNDSSRDHWHKFCKKVNLDLKSLPSRLIDIGQHDEWPCCPKLVEVSTFRSDGSKPPIYITLSHSWSTLSEDEQNKMKTTESNLKHRQAGIKLDVLPPQYQAVVLLCRRLEVRYLWIDSLCIIQGPGGDWDSESIRMADIYGGAYLTIATNTSQNLLESLCGWTDTTPASSHPNKMMSLAYAEAWRTEPDKWAPTFWKLLLEGGPIGDRAWCLQERQLTPRMLHLIDDGVMVFECNGCIACTASPEDVRRFAKDPRAINVITKQHQKALFPRAIDLVNTEQGTHKLIWYWYTILMDYQRRQLKFSQDNLKALQGVADLVAHASGYTYLSGHWLEDISRGLLWKRDSTSRRRGETWTRFKKYQGPTWSWCSVNGSTSMYGAELGLKRMFHVDQKSSEHPTEFKCTLISQVQVSPCRDPSETQPLVPDSYLEMQGLIGRFWYAAGLVNDTGDLHASEDAPGLGQECGSVIFDVPSERQSRELWCLVIVSSPDEPRSPRRPEYLGLALEQVATVSDGDTVSDDATPSRRDALSFKRIGLAIIRTWRVDDFDWDQERKAELELQKLGIQRTPLIRIY